MSDTYDKTSRLGINFEDLEHASYKKTRTDKVARRVSNEPDEPLYVALIDAPDEEDFFIQDELSGILKEQLTEIVRYTVPPGKIFNLDQITVSGDNIAEYTVTIDSVKNKTKRTYYGASLNEEFKYNSYKVTAAQIIKVEVIHYSEFNGAFEATIEGRLNNE